MGVNFVHFGNEHPTGDQHARLPSPLPPRLLSPQSAAVGRLAGRLEFTVSKASGSGCNSGYDRGRPSGRGSGSGNDDNILGESGQGNSNVSGCNTPGSVLTSLRTLASQDGGNCKEQDPPSAKAGKARGKGPALRKGGGVSCTPRSEGCGTGMHGKAASVVSPQTTILTVSTTATVLSDGDAPPTKRPKVVAVGPPQLALSGSKCGEDGAGSDREAPTGGLNTGPPACAVAAGPTGLMTTKTDVGNNTNHATIIQSDYLPVPGLEKVSTRPPSGTTSAPVLSPRGRLQPSKRASVLGSQEHQQLQEQAALPPSPSPSPVVSTDVIDDSANAQSPKTRAAKRRRLKDAHCGTPVSEHAIGSHCGPRVGSRNTDSSAFTSMAKSQQDSEIQNAPNRTAQVEKVMDTVSTGALVKGTNTTTAGAVAGEVVVSSGQSSPGGCSQQVQWVPVSHGAAQAAEPSSLPLAECLPGCGPPSGLQSGQGAESAHDSTLRPEGLGPRDVTKGCEVGGMSAGGGGGSIRVTGSDIHGMGGKGSVGDDDACGDDAGGSGNAQDGAADARGSCKRKAVGHGRVHSCNGAAMRSNNGPESTLRVVEMADLGATVAETAAAPTVGKCTTIPGDFMDATATGPADTTTNAWTMDTVVVATGVDVETVVGLVHMGLEAESRDPAPHHTPGADVAFDCARGALMPVSVAAGDGSTVVDREQMEHRGGDKEYVTALERRSREPSSRSCGEEAGLKMAREGDISGTADVSPGNIPGIEAQAAPLPPAAGEEAAATATVASIAVPETQGGLNSAEHPGTAAETLTVPVHERQQHLHESQQLGMEWERTYAGGEQFQSQLDTLPLPGGSEIALPPAPEPGPQRVPMELERHEPQPQSLSPCIPGIISAQRSLDPGLTEEPAAAAVDLSQEGAAGKTTVLSTGAHNPVEAPLVHHAIVAPLPAQHSKPLLPREVDGAVAVPRPGSCALTTSNPVPRHDELVAVGSISWQGGLGRCDSRGFRAGLHGEANARPIPGNPSVNNGASVPGGTNKDGGDYLSSGDLSAGGHACQGFRRHGSSSDGGGASASDYILAPPEAAPPPGLSATVTSEWLAWWYVANSTGYGRQAADVLAIARQQLTNVQANFRATIEDCCRQLGCLPLHLRVLQVHYVQQAYMSLKRVPPEAGAKLANQLLLLIKLFLCETARETQQYAETAGLSAMARAAPSAPQPGALGGISGGISGTVGGATRHGQGTAVADSSFAEATRQRHPGPIQMAQQTHHSHPDLNQTIRGLTLEEFWELMAVCGSHCVQIIMIAIGSERWEGVTYGHLKGTRRLSLFPFRVMEREGRF
ncbi:hypothetical protein Vafri_11336 [Volvox africanus]|nr:hypothetical protein Vafri_11336 [Volvox africanus]